MQAAPSFDMHNPILNDQTDITPPIPTETENEPTLQELVNKLNQDEETLKTMTPLQHLKFMQELPPSSPKNSLKPSTNKTAEILQSMDFNSILEFRRSSWLRWRKRKEELQEVWMEIWMSLAPSVQSVLGKNKNILLLEEMLKECNHPNKKLILGY